MSLRSQTERLLNRTAERRRDMWPQATIDYDNGRGQAPGYYAPIRKHTKNEQAGFLAPHDTFVRIPKTCGFAPELGKSIRIADPRLTITLPRFVIREFPVSSSTAEWVLGVDAQL